MAFYKPDRGFELLRTDPASGHCRTSRLRVQCCNLWATQPPQKHTTGGIWMFLYMVKVSKRCFCLYDGNKTDLFNSKHSNLISCQLQYLCTVLFLLKCVRAKFLHNKEKLQISKYWQNHLNDPMFFPL